ETVDVVELDPRTEIARARHSTARADADVRARRVRVGFRRRTLVGRVVVHAARVHARIDEALHRLEIAGRHGGVIGDEAALQGRLSRHVAHERADAAEVLAENVAATLHFAAVYEVAPGPRIAQRELVLGLVVIRRI